MDVLGTVRHVRARPGWTDVCSRTPPCAMLSIMQELSDSATSSAYAAQAQQAAAAGQIVQHLVQRLAGRLHDDRQCEGIEIADAIVVGQSRLRAHAHRRGHALSATHRAEAARSAQVARDDSQVVPTEQLGDSRSDVPMTGAMKSPAFHLQLLGPLVRDRVVRASVRESCCESPSRKPPPVGCRATCRPTTASQRCTAGCAPARLGSFPPWRPARPR